MYNSYDDNRLCVKRNTMYCVDALLCDLTISSRSNSAEFGFLERIDHLRHTGFITTDIPTTTTFLELMCWASRRPYRPCPVDIEKSGINILSGPVSNNSVIPKVTGIRPFAGITSKTMGVDFKHNHNQIQIRLEITWIQHRISLSLDFGVWRGQPLAATISQHIQFQNN